MGIDAMLLQPKTRNRSRSHTYIRTHKHARTRNHRTLFTHSHLLNVCYIILGLSKATFSLFSLEFIHLPKFNRITSMPIHLIYNKQDNFHNNISIFDRPEIETKSVLCTHIMEMIHTAYMLTHQTILEMIVPNGRSKYI